MVCRKLCQNSVSRWRSLEESNFAQDLQSLDSLERSLRGRGRGDSRCCFAVDNIPVLRFSLAWPEKPKGYLRKVGG